MPTYSFNCEKCNGVFEEFLTMSKCEEPLSEPCRLCQEMGGVQKAYLSAPRADIDTNHRVDKPQGGAFQERMQHILDTAPALDKQARENLGRHTSR